MPDPVIVNKVAPRDDGGSGPIATIERLINTLFSRVHALELRAPRDGKDGEPGRDGKDVDPSLIRQMVTDEVAKALAEQPKRKRVTTVTRWDEKGRIAAFEQEDI